MAEDKAVEQAEAPATVPPTEEKATLTEPAEKPVQTPEEDPRAFQAKRQAEKIDNLEAKLDAALTRLAQAEQIAQPQPQVNPQQFIDPITGLPDMAAYQRALQGELTRIQAENDAKLKAEAFRLEHARQEERVIEKYPELDPQNSNHDRIFYNALKAAIQDQVSKGQKADYVKLANDLRKDLDARTEKALESAKADMEDTNAKKEAAQTAAPQGGTESRQQTSEALYKDSELRQATVDASYGRNGYRKEDLNSIVGERLAKIPHVSTDNGQTVQ